MKSPFILMSVTSLLSLLAAPLLAQDADFNLTYHVERTPTANLSIETCGNAAVDVAQQAGLSVERQDFPGQLVTVSGGSEGSGAFVVQCIAAGDMTP